jgi:Mrp family chromosome partitioning ATPase
MELSRLKRIVQDRWLVLTIVGVIGAILGIVMASVVNDSQRPVYEATAAVHFELGEGQTFTDLADTVSNARDVATVAANEILSGEAQRGEENSFIVSDQASARVLFISRAETRDQAVQQAEDLRQLYFNVDPESTGDVDVLIERAEADVIEASDELLAITPTLSEADEDLLAQYDHLDQQIQAFEARLVELTVANASADSAQRQLNAAEAETINNNLDSLRGELAALPPRPDATPTADEQMKMTTLQRRIELSTAEYERLYLQKLGVGGPANSAATTVANVSPEPLSPYLLFAGGFLVGALIALFGLVLATRVRKPIWLPEDLPVRLLGSVPTRRVAGNTSEAWYDHADSGPRKSAIQRLRSAVEAQLPPVGASLAIAGHKLNAQNLQAVATDLAVSMASTGASVLIVDGDFGSSTPLGEYRAGAPSLAGVLALNPESPAFEAQISSQINGADLIRPGLSIVPAGPAPASPGDALAGRQFRRFVEKAATVCDVVIVVVGDIATPAAQVAMQRLRNGIVVLTPGRSGSVDVENALYDVGQRQVTMLGAVFLERSERQVRDETRRSASPQPQVTETPNATSLLERLGAYSSETTFEDPAPKPIVESLDVPVAEIAAADTEMSLGATLLAAIQDADPKVAYGAVADYLTVRVEDMLTLGAPQGELSDELVREVSEKGYVPLTPGTDLRTVGQWLKAEIQRETSPITAGAVIEEMERILSTHDGHQTDIDKWLSENFFKRHLRRSVGEPVVWHLSSERGEVQALVGARRIDPGRIREMIDVLVGSHHDELERRSRSADSKGDLEDLADLEARLAEVRRFEDALGAVIGLGAPVGVVAGMRKGSSENLEWHPDFSAGMRPNLAPFQAVGVLAVPVLSDDEVDSGLTVS